MPESKQDGKNKFVRRPNREIRFRTSKDGQYVMVDIVETWFFSSRYISKIADSAGKKGDPAVSGDQESAS